MKLTEANDIATAINEAGARLALQSRGVVTVENVTVDHVASAILRCLQVVPKQRRQLSAAGCLVLAQLIRQDHPERARWTAFVRATDAIQTDRPLTIEEAAAWSGIEHRQARRRFDDVLQDGGIPAAAVVARRK